MDPRETPEYQMHLALTNLHTIDHEEIEPGDKEKLQTAITLLEQIDFLTEIDDAEEPASPSTVL